MGAGELEPADRRVMEDTSVFAHMFVTGYMLVVVRMFVAAGDTFATVNTFVVVHMLEVVVVGGPQHNPCDGDCSSCVCALRCRIRLCTRVDCCCYSCAGDELKSGNKE